jgi:squalene-hopene/tetraprenyl-beta-curcumene cyclase
MAVADDVSPNASFAPQRLCVRLLCFLLLVSVCRVVLAQDRAASVTPLGRAAEYLWKQQTDDGGWHSAQYGVLRSGQALTPFVIDALLDVPESVYSRPEQGVARGLEFIRKRVDEQGAIGRSDPDVAEYPVYSTAYALRCLIKIRDDPKLRINSDLLTAARMASYLCNAQYSEAKKFTPSHAAYGGWGLDAAKEDGEPGHMDLAHTRRALEALRSGMPDGGSPAFTRGEIFLRVVQRHPGRLAKDPPPTYELLHVWSDVPFDGGFYFSPVVVQANKGRFSGTFEGRAGPHYRSYATATCDGLLALLACRVSRDDERVVKAIEWLREHEDFDYPEGVPRDHPEPWGEAIRFYHYAVRAEAYDALDWPGDWRTKLAAAVAKTQAEDGSFRNEASPLMKEDDPILCTTLAVVALSHCAE